MPDETAKLPHGAYLARRFDELCDLFAQGKGDPDTAQELKGVVRSMIATETGLTAEHGPYAHFVRPSHAAVEHLKTVPPYTLTAEQLVAAILAGGWGITIDARALKARVAVTYSINRWKTILEKDGKLALPEQVSGSEQQS